MIPLQENLAKFGYKTRRKVEFFESLLCDGGMENPLVSIWQFEPSFLQNVANLGVFFLTKSFVKVSTPFLFFLFVTEQ